LLPWKRIKKKVLKYHCVTESVIYPGWVLYNSATCPHMAKVDIVLAWLCIWRCVYILHL